MKAISLKIPDPLFHDLVQRAKLSASSQSEIVRLALTDYLQQDAPALTASCAERAQRWTGILHGPADLSTHARHFDGFGQ